MTTITTTINQIDEATLLVIGIPILLIIFAFVVWYSLFHGGYGRKI